MKIEVISSVIAAIVAVITLLLNLHDKHPRLLKGIVFSLLDGLPFGLIPHCLPAAIILFTIVRLFAVYREARKPNLCIYDVFVTMGALFFMSGFFAAVVAFIRR